MVRVRRFYISGIQTFDPLFISFFFAEKLLRVPHITKNLICVIKFALDNCVFFEFHPCFCLVRVLATQTVLQGTLPEGLYKFDLRAPLPTTPPHATFSAQLFLL